jgi:hypothetical protein
LRRSPPRAFPVVRPAAKGLGVKSRELIAGLVFAQVCCACLGIFLHAKRPR